MSLFVGLAHIMTSHNFAYNNYPPDLGNIKNVGEIFKSSLLRLLLLTNCLRPKWARRIMLTVETLALLTAVFHYLLFLIYFNSPFLPEYKYGFLFHFFIFISLSLSFFFTPENLSPLLLHSSSPGHVAAPFSNLKPSHYSPQLKVSFHTFISLFRRVI